MNEGMQRKEDSDTEVNVEVGEVEQGGGISDEEVNISGNFSWQTAVEAEGQRDTVGTLREDRGAQL